MKTRTVRKATLIGGIATGALLFAGSAAQASEAPLDDAGLDAIQSVPDRVFDGVQVPADAVPGLDAVKDLPSSALDKLGLDLKGGQDGEPASEDVTAESAGVVDAVDTAGGTVGELLDNLGGGLPAKLPF